MSELQLRIGQIDPEAKRDILTIASSEMQPWSNTQDLKFDNVELPGNYATNENNYTIADGTFEELPDDVSGRTWGVFSGGLSSGDGIFSTPITLSFTFSNLRTINGCTFFFYPHTNDYPTKVGVSWYEDIGGTSLIHGGSYEISGIEGSFSQTVTNFLRMDIEFLETNNPFRFLKLYAIEFGLIRIVFDHEIESVDVYEDLDNTAESISTNTISVRIRTHNAVFSPISSERYTDIMMERQPLYLHKNQEFFRLFFLDKWRDVTGDGILFDISGNDAINILDTYMFNGGIYSDVLVTDLLDEIFNICFPTKIVWYEIELDISVERLTGYLPRETCGFAFQQIMFAINATADTTISKDIYIRSNATIKPAQSFLPLQRQFADNSSISLKPYVYGVTVLSYRYFKGVEDVTVASDEQFLPGQHIIYFDEPLHSLHFTPSDVLVDVEHVNYVVFTVLNSKQITLVGKRYVAATIEHNNKGFFIAGQQNATVKYEGYTLVDRGKGILLARRLYNMHLTRLKVEQSVVLGNMKIGDRVIMGTRHNDVIGIVKSLNTGVRADSGIIEIDGNVNLEKGVSPIYTGMRNTGMGVGVIYAR